MKLGTWLTLIKRPSIDPAAQSAGQQHNSNRPYCSLHSQESYANDYGSSTAADFATCAAI